MTDHEFIRMRLSEGAWLHRPNAAERPLLERLVRRLSLHRHPVVIPGRGSPR